MLPNSRYSGNGCASLKPQALLLFYLVLMVIPLLLAGQQKTIRFDHMTIEQGLSQSVVNCILQDHIGYMWFGTQDGLNKFDGYTFKKYKHDADDLNSLSNNYVWTILEDKRGAIWIGTDEGGLNKLEPDSGKFTHYRHKSGEASGLSHDKVRTLLEDRNGVLWIGTGGGGLNRFDPLTGQITQYKHSSENSRSLSHDTVTALFQSGNGNLWVGTAGGGLNRLNRDLKTFTRFTHHPDQAKSLSHNNITSLYEHPPGVLWIGTDGGGLNRLEVAKRKFTRFQMDPRGHFSINSNRVMSICRGEEWILWIGTFGGGLNRFDMTFGHFTSYTNDTQDPQSLSHNYVRTIYMDQLQTLWVGTWGAGINKYDKKKSKFAPFTHLPDHAESLNIRDVWAIMEDRQANLWIGTYGNGLCTINRQGGTCKYYTHNPKDTNSLSGNEILCLLQDRQGFIWIGTDSHGLDKLMPDKGQFFHFRHNPADEQSLSNNEVMCLWEDSSGILWIGTNGGGLNKMDREKNSFQHFKHNPDIKDCISHNEIVCIHESSKGILWIGTDGGGLDRFNSKNNHFLNFKHDSQRPDSLSNNYVLCITETASGIMWIGTYGGGFNRFDSLKQTFTHFTEKHGLADNSVYGILQDGRGNLWLSTNRGLANFDPKSGQFRNFDADDGLQSNEFTQGAFCKTTDGEMIFGGIKGFNIFHPEDIKNNPHVPAIVITSFRVFDKEEALGNFMTGDKKVKLSYKQNFFSFEFSALDFSAPEKNRYSYKMEGFNKGWISRGTRRYADYTNVPPGKYKFRVKGSNNDGLWNDEGISFDIVITPPFWQKWWFISLLLLFFAGLSYMIISLSRKYLTLITFWKKRNHIGRYKLEAQIGTGGMGTIYHGTDIMDSSTIVAIKVIREEFTKDAKLRERFLNEAVIVDQLDHPNIVKIIERGEFNNRLFIAMELLEGPLLSEIIMTGNTISMRRILHITIQLLDAIHTIHLKGIIHRDLKPENIMLIERDDDLNHVKLMDFGLARIESITRITDSGMVMGTLTYLAPEQIATGEFSAASDIYSLGVILYEMLTLNKPFMGETTIDIMKQILEKEPIPPITFRPEIHSRLNEITMKMITKEPQARPTPASILTTLKIFLADL